MRLLKIPCKILNTTYLSNYELKQTKTNYFYSIVPYKWYRILNRFQTWSLMGTVVTDVVPRMVPIHDEFGLLEGAAQVLEPDVSSVLVTDVASN